MRCVASERGGTTTFLFSFLFAVLMFAVMQILASGSYDDTIKLYIDDPSDDWYCFSTLTGHGSTVWSLAWSLTHGYLASGSDDRTVRIWKRVAAHKWESVLVLEGHERSVYGVSWGKGNGQEHVGWLASVGGDGVLRVWDVAERDGTTSAQRIAAERASHGVHDANAVSFCARPGFEHVLATAGDDGCVVVWEVVETI